MSSNRSNTDCECGFWSFQRSATKRGSDERPPTDPGLMTFRQYMADIGVENPRHEPWSSFAEQSCQPFRRELEGERVYRWRGPDGNGYANHPIAGGEKTLEAVYSRVPPEDRYRYAKLVCSVCFRTYVGWYVLQPWVVEGPWLKGSDGPLYSLYDTSWYHSFGDSPDDKDVEHALDWTSELLVKAVREYIERHPDVVPKIARR